MIDLNPKRVKEAETKESVKITIGHVPLSLSTAEIEKALKTLDGLSISSNWVDECYRDKNNKLSCFKTGRRFFYAHKPSSPLPKEIEVGKFKASIYYRGQKEELEKLKMSSNVNTSPPKSGLYNPPPPPTTIVPPPPQTYVLNPSPQLFCPIPTPSKVVPPPPSACVPPPPNTLIPPPPPTFFIPQPSPVIRLPKSPPTSSATPPTPNFNTFPPPPSITVSTGDLPNPLPYPCTPSSISTGNAHSLIGQPDVSPVKNNSLASTRHTQHSTDTSTLSTESENISPALSVMTVHSADTQSTESVINSPASAVNTPHIAESNTLSTESVSGVFSKKDILTQNKGESFTSHSGQHANKFRPSVRSAQSASSSAYRKRAGSIDLRTPSSKSPRRRAKSDNKKQIFDYCHNSETATEFLSDNCSQESAALERGEV